MIAHRQHISRWSYDCGYETDRGLGAMYLSDAGFAADYNKARACPARFIDKAIVAEPDRAETNRP